MKYAYDAVGQLLTETDNISGAEVATSYSYDLLGNRLTKQVGSELTSQVVTNYVVDKLNRVLSYNDTTNTVNYVYDVNGNRISKTFDGKTHSYEYDSESRLMKVLEDSNEIFRAKYDYRTRRTETFENDATTLYVYDGGTNIQERSATGSLTKQLIRGSGMGGGIGSVLYTDSSVDGADDEDGESESRRFFIYNAIGSTVALTNTASAVMSADCYDAFGKVVASLSGSNDDENRKFCTKERSESIGLDNFGFRYYDYELGKFLTRDPLGYPDGPNNTLYCNNNPINKLDPLGLAKKSEYLDQIQKLQNKYDSLHKNAKKKPFYSRMARYVGAIENKAIQRLKNHVKDMDKHFSRRYEKGRQSFGSYDYQRPKEYFTKWDDENVELNGNISLPDKKELGQLAFEAMTGEVLGIAAGKFFKSRGSSSILRMLRSIPNYFRYQNINKARLTLKMLSGGKKYQGLGKANALLKNSGYTWGERTNELINGVADSYKVMKAGKNTTAYRYWGGAAGEYGRYLSPSNPIGLSRNSLALPPSWNSMENLTQFRIQPGVKFIQSTIAQQVDDGVRYSGGAKQILVPDTKVLTK